MRLVLKSELVETHTLHYDLCVTWSWASLWTIILNIDILVVSESILHIPVVKSLVINELLTIKGNRHYNRYRHLGFWWSDVHFSVCKVCDILLDSSISNGHITDTFLIETLSNKLGHCASSQRANAWENWMDLRVDVIYELNMRVSILFPIQSYWNVVVRSTCVRVTKGWRQRRGVALDGVLIHDGGVHLDSVIKDALDLVETHINEVFTWNCDLGVASYRSTGWSDIVNFRGFIIEILNSLRGVALTLIGDSEGYKTWVLYLGCYALDSVTVKWFSFGQFFSEFASYVFWRFEFVTINNNWSTSLGWTLSWINIKDLGWSVIEVRYVIISVLLIVKGNFNYSLV